MNRKEDIALDWLRRYTGTNPDDYGDWILLTNLVPIIIKIKREY